MVGDKILDSPLNEDERALVEKWHNIIYRCISDTHLTAYIDDIYGDAALMLMVAARRYIQTSRLQSYSFATIAYRQIRKVCTEYYNKKAFQNSRTVSLDDEDLNFYNTLESPEHEEESEAERERSQIQYSLVIGLLTEKERTAILRHADGLNARQVEKVYGTKPRTHSSAVERAIAKCYAHYGEIWDTDEVVELPKHKSKRYISEEEGALIKKMYREGMKVNSIARKLERYASVIKAYLIREGVIDG